MLVIIGPTWKTAEYTDAEREGELRLRDPEDWVRKEITLALNAHKIVIPVLLDGVALPDKGWLKKCELDRLCEIQTVPLRNSDYTDDLSKLIAAMRDKCPELPSPKSGTSIASKRLPTPPELYAVPNYILTSKFIGRATELDLLDGWAKSSDPLMVVEGIGGLGKSALTWEWVQKRAEQAIPNLAGRVWWSFYERGTSMATFVRQALAYVTAKDPETLSKEHYERCQELLTELKRRPFLLVLDGFERVLTAYHRWDKAQQRDDKVEAELRDCVERRDGEFLQQLLHISPSKIILSTRLFPSILEDPASGRPIPGVAYHKLNGLSRPDALVFFRHAEIVGNEQAMLDFAAQFGYHSLLLKVLCGEITKYPKKPYHFDAWRADPIYGGKLKLSKLDLKQRYNHILRFALEGLDESKQKLLSRIAVLSENMTYDVLAVLNPFLPPKPKAIEDLKNPAHDWIWEFLDADQKQKRMAAYENSLRPYTESAEYQQAIREFDQALEELQDRGLLQWDRKSGHYDMHPVVRGHAAELLEARDREQTFLTVRDHFASLPPDDLKKATELSHVAHSLEIYRCLLGAGRLDEAAGFYGGDLAETLLYHLGAHSIVVELLTPLFRGGQDGLPRLSSVSNQSLILIFLANSLGELGKEEEALGLYIKRLSINLKASDWGNVAAGLENIAWSLRILNRLAEAAAALALAMDLAKAIRRDDHVTGKLAKQGLHATDQGQFALAEQLFAEFFARPVPPIYIYTPGDAEYYSCFCQFSKGTLIESEWQSAYERTVQERNVLHQHQLQALRSDWLLTQDRSAPARPTAALNAVDEALKVANRIGTPRPDYHDLRAWALARLGRHSDAVAELASGQHGRFAAEAWLVLGDREKARTCALNGYRWAWADGPPYIRWYDLERSRALLKELGEPEPELPPFDPRKVKPIPHEREIRAAIDRLKKETKSRSRDHDTE